MTTRKIRIKNKNTRRKRRGGMFDFLKSKSPDQSSVTALPPVESQNSSIDEDQKLKNNIIKLKKNIIQFHDVNIEIEEQLTNLTNEIELIKKTYLSSEDLTSADLKPEDLKKMIKELIDIYKKLEQIDINHQKSKNLMTIYNLFKTIYELIIKNA
jgi:hypothetical protein